MEKLYDDLINQLIEIGRSEIIPSIPDSEFSYLREGQWQRSRYPEDCDSYSIEELKLLFKGLVLCEKHFEWMVGSTTNTAWVLRNIEARLDYDSDYDEIKELYDFGFANRGENPYAPTGSQTHSDCNTYEEFEEVVHQKLNNIAKHDEQMLREQKASKERKKLKAKSMKERAERKKERDKALKRKNGLHTRYYDNGQILSKEHYKDGKLDGKWTFWYENGQKQLEANFTPYEVLPEDCRAERSSPYIFPARDSKDGKWTEWYENGQKKLEQNYKCGRVIGKWTTWDENGQKKFEGHYKDGGMPGIRFAIREGKWTVWDENGQLMEENYYKNGELKDWKITTIRNWINKYL